MNQQSGEARFATVLAVAILSVAPFAASIRLTASEPMYSLTDLGTLGGECSSAAGLNNAGQVIGASTATGRAGDWNVPYYPFVYSNGVMTQIAGAWGLAHDINDVGQVVGQACVEPGPCYRAEAFVYENGALRLLGALPGNTAYPYSTAYGINNTGTIVGESKWEGMIYRDGEMTGLSRRAARQVTRVNDAGRMIGWLENFHAFFFDGDRLIDLGTLDGAQDSDSRPGGINSRGQIVGAGYVSTQMTFHAFLYENDVMRDLGTLNLGDGWTSYSWASDINNAGDIVGESDGTAFIYRNGVMTDLNTLLPAGTPRFTGASAINDNGQIAGLVWTSGCAHAALLTPVASTPVR